MPKLNYFYTLILWVYFSNAQNPSLDRLFEHAQLDLIEQVIFQENELSEIENKLATANYYTVQKKLDKSFQILLSIDTLGLTNKSMAYYHHYLGKAHDHNGSFDLAYQHYQKAQRKYLEIGDKLKYNKLNLDIYYTMLDPAFYKNSQPKYLKEFEENAHELQDVGQLCLLQIEYAFNSIETDTTFQEFLIHLDKAYAYNRKDKNSFVQGILHTYKGMYYTDYVFNKDSAKYYYNKGIQINKRLGLGNKVRLAYHNLGELERIQGNYHKAIEFAKMAINDDNINIDYDLNAYVFRLMADDFMALEQPDSAYVYLEKSMNYRDSLNIQKQNINLTRFQAEKKDRENLILTQKNETNRIIIYASFGAFSVLLILSFLYYQNFKKKQLIKQQETQLKVNETEKKLKEQELKAIDALLEGQEKERQQIASDLHDHIGANLASISAYFEVLKQKMSNTADASVFDKVYQLLKETYKDIRGISHYKNSTVIADKAFIVALKDLTQKLQVLHEIQFNIHSFNENQKIPHYLEVTLFRILQELLANIIKHAQAKNVEIYVNFYEDSLNIIVEDDGVGFDTSEVKDDGIGLSSIKKRLKAINGEMQIDTQPNRGTTIILDLTL